MDHLTPEQLLDYADKTLAAEQAHDVAAHLASCPACREELASLQQVAATLAEDNWIMPPDSARAAAQQAFRRQYGNEPAPHAPLTNLAGWLRGLTMPRWQQALALALLLVFAAALFIVLDEPDGVYTASASAVIGTVEAQEPGSNAWRPVGEGETLQTGDTVRTDEDSSLLLSFPDGSSSSLLANTVVTLDGLQEIPRTIVLGLGSGESVLHVAPSAEREARFEMNTPTATITSAGGDFNVVVDILETTYVRVVGGAVTVSSAGRTLALEEGQEALVAAGQPPRLLTVDEDLTPTPTPSPIPSPTLTPQPEVTMTPTPTETAAPPAPVDDPGDDETGDGDEPDDDDGGESNDEESDDDRESDDDESDDDESDDDESDDDESDDESEDNDERDDDGGDD